MSKDRGTRRAVYAHDGVSVYDRFLLTYLRQRFDDVTLVSFHREAACDVARVRTVVLRSLLPRMAPGRGLQLRMETLPRALLIRSYLRRVKPNVVIGSWATTYGFYCAFSDYHPFVLIAWGSDLMKDPRIPILNALARYSLRSADLVVVDSRIHARACIKLGCSWNKIIRLPWFDAETFPHDIPVQFRKEIRRSLGVDPDWPLVISTRNHESTYDVGTLIEAIPLVLKKEPHARFVLLGKGSQTTKLQARAKQLGIQKAVNFIGWVPRDKVAHYLGAADIYVSTSRFDGTSASLLEAMVNELPAVVTSIPGNREWVVEHANGLFFSPQQVGLLAEALLNLINNPRLRKQMGKAGRSIVEEQANWTRNSLVLDRALDALTT